MILAIDIFILGLTIFLVYYEEVKVRKNAETIKYGCNDFLRVLLVIYLVIILCMNVLCLYFDREYEATRWLYIYLGVSIFVIITVFYKRLWKRRMITNAIVIMYILLSFVLPVYQKKKTNYSHDSSSIDIEFTIPIMQENPDTNYYNCFSIRINKRTSDELWVKPYYDDDDDENTKFLINSIRDK